MADERYYEGVGRRKRATARVRIYANGSGQFLVNDKPLEDYFRRLIDRVEVRRPFQATGTMNDFDVTVQVKGGGMTGQSGAVKMGLARALVEYDDNMRTPLRRGGHLTRDSREKERKKPGLKRARKAPTYTKR
jgi:small subunit ribosomal protein S9